MENEDAHYKKHVSYIRNVARYAFCLVKHIFTCLKKQKNVKNPKKVGMKLLSHPNYKEIHNEIVYLCDCSKNPCKLFCFSRYDAMMVELRFKA